LAKKELAFFLNREKGEEALALVLEGGI